MLKIYGYAASINVRKVLWMCQELGLSYEREDWGGNFRPTSDPRFRMLNPVGMVPVIDDDGRIIWESNVIVRYLAASRGRADLLPVQVGDEVYAGKIAVKEDLLADAGLTDGMVYFQYATDGAGFNDLCGGST